MKSNIHPKYYEDARVICACGNTFTVGSTKKEIHIETCYKCHPFYTGEHRYVDTQGKVQQFKNKMKIAQQMKSIKKKKRVKKQQQKTHKTLKELLGSL